VAHRLFRLWLRKGKPFAIQTGHNPPIEHDGGNTVVSLYLTELEENSLKLCIGELSGCEYDLIPHEHQTGDQTRERQTLLGLQRGDRTWPSVACPTCTWFDPLLEGEPCGRAGWPPESIVVFSDTETATLALAECPVKHVWKG
jgi:hypothetical protein